MSVPSDPSADPGWGGASRGLLWMAVPGPAARRLQRAPDGLLALRALFVTFVGALGSIAVVVAVLAATRSLEPSGLPVRVVAAAVVLVGIGELFAARLFARTLDCSSLPALAGSYRTRFFVRLAFADASALVGFVGFILTANAGLYILGLAFATVGFARLAPSARHLAQDQAELRLAGCSHSLVEALRTTPPATRS